MLAYTASARAAPNNAMHPTANGVAFIRETLLLLRFAAPG